MAKPTDLAPWATDDNYPADSEPEASTPTKVAYTLGQEAVGWRPKARPPARELNTWMNRVGKWIDYLNAGELEGDHIVTGSLFVPNARVEADAGYYGTDETLALFPQGLVSEAPIYFTDPQTLHVQPSLWHDAGGSTHTKSHNVWILAASTDAVYVPINLPVGAVITAWRIGLQKNTSDASEIEAQMIYSAGGADTSVGDSGSNADDSSGAALIQVTDQQIEILNSASHYLRITPSGSIAPAADRLWEVAVEWIMPPP